MTTFVLVILGLSVGIGSVLVLADPWMALGFVVGVAVTLPLVLWWLVRDWRWVST